VPAFSGRYCNCRPKSLRRADLPTIKRRPDNSRGGQSRGVLPRRTALEDIRDNTLISTTVSRSWSPRVDTKRLTLCQPRTSAERRRNPAWGETSSRPRAVPESPFDPDYAAFRAMLQSLATDGQRLVGRIPGSSSPTLSRQVRSYLRRIDRFDELAAARGVETVRRWAHRLKSLVLQVAENR
jgi:hypothetical protein